MWRIFPDQSHNRRLGLVSSLNHVPFRRLGPRLRKSMYNVDRARVDQGVCILYRCVVPDSLRRGEVSLTEGYGLHRLHEHHTEICTPLHLYHVLSTVDWFCCDQHARRPRAP